MFFSLIRFAYPYYTEQNFVGYFAHLLEFGLPPVFVGRPIVRTLQPAVNLIPGLIVPDEARFRVDGCDALVDGLSLAAGNLAAVGFNDVGHCFLLFLRLACRPL